ncbi:tetratricopeptide repeat protein [Horticoccus sp. 23ND18S-11]|uniref:tetratricopeptide repeat protein n=1 Tax=Horticoccus sp. 23ND18S-11 TaxID=3391832 RepID=UPI0039C97D42
MLRPVLALSVLALATLSSQAHPGLEEALVRLNAGIAATPENPELYLERGELYTAHEDWIAAEANLLRAAELSPHHPRLDRARALLALATGHASDALTLINVALQRAPADPDALLVRARAQARLGQRDAAVADLNGVLTLVATPAPELFLERAALLPPAEAVRSLDDGVRRIGPALSLQLRALELELALGAVDAAVARIDGLADRSERKESWLKRRGDVLARAGRIQEARASYAAALAAIAALPDWLRASPPTVKLAEELSRITAVRPTSTTTS